MNIFWNSVDPINPTDFKRVIGDLEIAAVDSLFECLTRYFIGLKPNVVETILANKLSLHFEPGVRGYGNVADLSEKPADMTTVFKTALIGVISEGVASKGILRTTEKGFHMPLYSWQEYVSIFVGRFISRFALSVSIESLPQAIQDGIAASVAHVNNSARVVKGE